MKFVLCVCLILYFCNSISAQQSWFNWREWVDTATSNPNTGSIGRQGIKGPDESNRPGNAPRKPWRRRPGRPFKPQYPDSDDQVGDAVQERLIFNKKKDKEKEKEKEVVVVEKPKKKGGYKRKGCRSVHTDPDDHHHEHHEDHGSDDQVGDAVQERLIFNKKKDKEKEKEVVVVEKPSYKRKGCRSAHTDPDDHHHEHHEDHAMEGAVMMSLPNEPMPRANTVIPTK